MRSGRTADRLGWGTMKTILVPVDLSAESVSVCAAACGLARLVRARLLLLHVVQPPPPMMSEIYALDPGQSEEMLVAAEQAGEAGLQRLAAKCRARGVAVSTVRRLGLPVNEILTRAAKAGYIVMGSHGHGAMYDLLVGSTTHGVLRRAPCPVLVVPPHRKRVR